MLNRSPRSDVARATFGNQSMNMWVPLQISAKGVKNTDKARSKTFCFIHFEEHAENDIANSVEKAVQKRAVLKEIRSKFFRNRKHTMSMNRRDQFGRHMQRTQMIIFISTGGPEAAFACKCNKMEVAADRATKHSTAL